MSDATVTWSLTPDMADEMWRMALRAQPWEAGGVCYGQHVVWLANRSGHLFAYTPDQKALDEVVARFKRKPDATWHSHQGSPELSPRDAVSLRDWDFCSHVVVDVNGNHLVHRLTPDGEWASTEY